MLPVRVTHVDNLTPWLNGIRDPFDRMLIAQAMVENLVLVSNEQNFDAYGVGRLW